MQASKGSTWVSSSPVRLFYAVHPYPKTLPVCTWSACCRSQRLAEAPSSNCNYTPAAAAVCSPALSPPRAAEGSEEWCRAEEINTCKCAFLNEIWHPSGFRIFQGAKGMFVLFILLITNIGSNPWSRRGVGEQQCVSFDLEFTLSLQLHSQIISLQGSCFPLPFS